MWSDDSVNLSKRATPSELPEWMDESRSYEDFRDCLLDLRKVNVLTLGYRPTLDFLDQVIRAKPLSEPLRVLDVGSGGGDMLQHVERWGKSRGVAVELVGVDLNPYAARAAREFAGNRTITWITGDAFAYSEPVDVVLSSLFTHHLEDNEIVSFLAWSEGVGRRGWFVNDLCREIVPYKLFGPLAKLMQWHRFVQHDGPVSFRRSFREADWKRLVAASGIDLFNVWMQRWTPGRLCLGRIK